MNFVEYLDEMVDKAQANVDEYEEFHGNKLVDVRNLDSQDSFLYGVASGKLDMIKDLRNLIIELMYKYENP